jgi:4-amino-4-deoxy-L-arabinose transferase-like glycosyltransferase
MPLAQAVMPGERRASRWWIVVVASLLFTAGVRVRLLDIPFERDEGEYAYAGQLMLQGVPPYALVYNMKLPGTYAAFALIEAVFGETVKGIHFGFLLVNAGAIVLVFLLGRRLFGPVAGVVACASYALMSVSPGIYGTSAHATHFVVLPALAGFLLLLDVGQSGRLGRCFVSALLFGLAFLMKQQGVFFAIFAWLLFAGGRLRTRPFVLRKAMADVALFTLGLAAPFAVTCAVLWVAGVWDHFWFWTILYAREYVSMTSVSVGLRNFREQFPLVIGPAVLIWCLAAGGLAVVLYDRELRERRALILSFAVFSFLTVVPGLYFRGHYFVTALPAVAILAGAGVDAVRRQLVRRGRRGSWAAVPAALAVVALGWLVLQQETFFFRASPVEASRMMYGLEPFPEAIEIARWLETQTGEQDRILVWGAEPEIYFYARRRSATGYIYVFGVWEENRYSEHMAQEMMREIEAAQPKYIVVEFIPNRLMSRARQYLARSYTVDGRIDMISNSRTEYYWGDQARTPRPAAQRTVVVFGRTTAR